jgi:hypothetical protein
MAPKTIRRFRQWDMHTHQDGDNVLTPDADGDMLTFTDNLDFGETACIRVRVPTGTPHQDVVRALHKIATDIARWGADDGVPQTIPGAPYHEYALATKAILQEALHAIETRIIAGAEDSLPF